MNISAHQIHLNSFEFDLINEQILPLIILISDSMKINMSILKNRETI